MKICVVSHPAESVQLKCQSREHGINVHTYIHILLARPGGAFQSQCYNNNFKKHSYTPKAKNTKKGFH